MDSNNIEVQIAEVPVEVVALNRRIDALTEGQSRLQQAIVIANNFAREIGEKLKEYAENNDLCDEYDTFLKAFGSEVLASGVYETFYEAAKREAKRVTKTFGATLMVNIESNDYEYELNESATVYAEGEYELPEDMEINEVEDLDDDRVEHVSGTDLVRWVSNAEDNGIDLEVNVDVDGFNEA